MAIEVNKDLVRLLEEYKKLVGNTQVDAASALVLAHVQLETVAAMKNFSQIFKIEMTDLKFNLKELMS